MATNETTMSQQFSDASNAQFRIDATLYLDGVETNRGVLDLDRNEFPKEQFFDSMKDQIHHRIKKELLPDS